MSLVKERKIPERKNHTDNRDVNKQRRRASLASLEIGAKISMAEHSVCGTACVRISLR